MVRKSEKRGVHSGNTLRASNSKYNRLYRSQAVLIRNLKNSSTTDTLLDELSISSDGIEYSLNKKGRWIVPQLLKEHIVSNRNHAGPGDEVNVTLTESHKIKRNAKCVGFYATKGPIKKVIPRNKTYFNAKSLQPRCGRKLRKTRNRKRIAAVPQLNEDDDEEIPLSPELNIEVYYPSPMTSSITHNPKYIENWREHKNGRRKKQRVRMNSKCLRDYVDDFEYTFSDEENDEILDEELPSSQQPMELLLDDILFHASKMQKLCSQKRNTSTSKIEEIDNIKPNIVYLDSNRTEAETDEQLQAAGELTTENVGTESTTQYSKMLPTYVILPSADVQPFVLRENFGMSYLECPCFPRKFVIDITNRITAFAKNSRIFQGRSHGFDFTASVVFDYDMDNMLEHTNGNVYKVFLNLKSKQNYVQIETISDFMTLTVDEVIQRTLFFIETLPYDYFYELEKSTPRTEKDVNLQNLDVCLRTKTDTYYPTSKRIYQEIFQNQNGGEIDNKSSNAECLPSSTCYICFESIACGEKFATALHDCGHWFCNDCWHDHLRSRIDMGYEKITCPEYKCEAMVDNGTLLTLINVQYVEQLAKREHDSKIAKFEETKWCPNLTCGRVLKIENLTTKALNVKCGCGKTFCFDCLQPAHWPASCESSVNYWTKLNASRLNDAMPVDFVMQVHVYGKHCPKCKKFIEKNGGCNSMVCVCGASFCWACMRLWSKHSVNSCLQSGDRKNAIKKEVNHINYMYDQTLSSKGYAKLYKLAVRHRANRHPWKIRAMKSSVYNLSPKLKYMIRKQGDKYGMELKEYETEEDNLRNYLDKIPVFLSSMVDLYIEINYVIEYTAVYLQGDVKDHRSLVPVLDRLSYLADNISEVFNIGVNQDIKAILRNLWKLRHHSKCGINQLVRLVSIKNKT